MQTKTACELPDSFNGQFGAVRGKKIQVKLGRPVARAATYGCENDGRGNFRNDHYAFTGNPTGLA